MTPDITLRTQLVAVVLSSLWLLAILYLVVKESLALRSSLGWVLLGLLALGLSVYPKALIWLAGATGIGLAANALFLLAFLAVSILLFGHTLAITKLLSNLRDLAQRIALHELEDRQRAGPAKPQDEGAGGGTDPQEDEAHAEKDG